MQRTRRASRRWPVRRFRVVDRSMEPTLLAGEGLIAVRSRRVRVGQLRVARHPARPDFWMVKRVAQAAADRRLDLRSDNTDAPVVDSGSFGAVPAEGTYLVIAVVTGPEQAGRRLPRVRSGR